MVYPFQLVSLSPLFSLVFSTSSEWCLGSSFGRLVGEITQILLPSYTISKSIHFSPALSLGTYAYIGAASMLAGVTRRTVSLVVYSFFSSLIPRLWWWKSLMMFLLWFPWWSLHAWVDLSLTQLILASTMMASIWRHFTHSTSSFIVHSICWVWTPWSSQTLQCILICSLITD